MGDAKIISVETTCYAAIALSVLYVFIKLLVIRYRYQKIKDYDRFIETYYPQGETTPLLIARIRAEHLRAYERQRLSRVGRLFRFKPVADSCHGKRSLTKNWNKNHLNTSSS